MAKIDKRICDACGAEIQPDGGYVQIFYWRAPGGDTKSERDRELREIFEEAKDFCDLGCVSRWLVAASVAQRSPKQ